MRWSRYETIPLRALSFSGARQREGMGHTLYIQYGSFENNAATKFSEVGSCWRSCCVELKIMDDSDLWLKFCGGGNKRVVHALPIS